MIEDRAEHRVSSCPVHFIWDGKGVGRMPVRWGFFALVAAAMLASAGRWLHVEAFVTAATVVGACGALGYLAGQVMTAAVTLKR